jgi:hypothetical protein
MRRQAKIQEDIAAGFRHFLAHDLLRAGEGAHLAVAPRRQLHQE